MEVSPLPRRPRYQTLARAGLLSRGLVYLLVGVLALMVVMHEPGGRTTDTRGAMRSLMHEPAGEGILLLIAVGLLCYSAWRLLQCINDSDRFGSGWLGLAVRGGQFMGAIVYLALAAYAINLVFEFIKESRGGAERHLARWLFSWPMGDWMVGAVGVGVVLFGLGQVIFAWLEGFRAFIDIPKRRARYVITLCKYGLVARGLVFTIIGWFFINAALKHSPREAGGFKEAWAALRVQPHGDLLVAAVALGFIAYAFFSAIEAAYRRR